MRSERYMRLFIVFAMSFSLFLPVHKDVGMFAEQIVGFASYVPNPWAFIYLWFPLVLLCNTLLLFTFSRGLQRIYRVSLFLYLPLEWIRALLIGVQVVGLQVGHWVVPAVVSAAALVEVFFMIRDRQKKRRRPAETLDQVPAQREEHIVG